MTVLQVGEKVRVSVEKVAHGGHFIARHNGAVIFLRHAIPGEDVTAIITEVTKNFARADAIEVHSPSPDRITPICRYAGVCGGCDFQHISYSRQRELKSDVIHEQFARIAKMELRIPVAECGDPLGWRVRALATADPDGRLGFYRYRSNEILPIDDCPVLHPSLHYVEIAKERFTPGERVRLLPADGVGVEISESSFWQGHVNAPRVLTQAVTDMADIKEGDHIFDLYGGVGLFSRALLPIIGPGGRIDLIEGNKEAVSDARRAFEDAPHVHIHQGKVEKILYRFTRADVILLDPPREGAGKKVIEEISRMKPRAIVYIACDPASLARDTTYLRDSGYTMASIRAFDLFPMTHHIELIAVYQPDLVR